MKYPLFFLLFLLVGCEKFTTAPPVKQYPHTSVGSYAATISDNAQFAAVSSIEDGIAFWDLQNNTLKYQWKHHDNAENLVLSVAISHNNSHVFTADQNTYALWQTSTGQNVGFWQLDTATVRDIAVSDNGAHLLVGKSNGGVQHITLSSGRRLEFLGHREKVNSVAISPNGRFALTGANDYFAYFWDTQSAQIIYSFPHPSRVTKVALDAQGRFAFTADSQDLAQIWDLQNGKLISKLQISARHQIYGAARFSPDGKYLVTGSPNRTLALWDVKTGKALQHWQVATKSDAHPSSAVVHAVAFLDEKHIISESSSGIAEVWEIKHDTK